MVLDAHASLTQVVLEAAFENLVNLPQSILVLILATRQMTIDGDDALASSTIRHFDFEADGNGAFVAESTQKATGSNLTRHKRLGRNL